MHLAPLENAITQLRTWYLFCPVFPRTVEQRHVSFPDPATASGSEAQRLEAFRAVRDDIRARLLPTLG